jgi:hypothetical protein
VRDVAARAEPEHGHARRVGVVTLVHALHAGALVLPDHRHELERDLRVRVHSNTN